MTLVRRKVASEPTSLHHFEETREDIKGKSLTGHRKKAIPPSECFVDGPFAECLTPHALLKQSLGQTQWSVFSLAARQRRIATSWSYWLRVARLDGSGVPSLLRREATRTT